MDAAGDRVEPERPAPTTSTPEPESEPIETALGGGSERRMRTYERPYAAEIDCPVCEQPLDAQGSALRSVRCEECGNLLTFDEVIALREREHARASRYI
jgi:hypothetical protein